MIGQFIIKPALFTLAATYEVPFLSELQKLEGNPVDYKYVEALVKVGWVDEVKKCNLWWYPFNYPWTREIADKIAMRRQEQFERRLISHNGCK